MNSWMVDLGKGDEMTFNSTPGKGLSVEVKGEQKGVIEDEAFSKAFWAIFIGEKPPTDKLKQGQLDVIIISPPYDEPGVLTLPLYEEPFVVVLPSAHPLSKHRTIEQKQLLDESLLLLGSGNCFRDQVIRACPDCAPGDAGEHLLQHTLEGSSLETIRHMVASGMGITVLPCTAAGADRYSQRLLAIRRTEDGFDENDLGGVIFVPMLSGLS